MDTKKAVFVILFVGVLMSKKHRKYSKEYLKESANLIVEEDISIGNLKRAFKNECIGSTLIHNFNRGVQHVSKEFQALLKTNDILCSMSRKGNCRDNLVAESFLHTY